MWDTCSLTAYSLMNTPLTAVNTAADVGHVRGRDGGGDGAVVDLVQKVDPAAPRLPEVRHGEPDALLVRPAPDLDRPQMTRLDSSLRPPGILWQRRHDDAPAEKQAEQQQPRCKRVEVGH